jgi:hypothetical protein
MKYNQNQLRIGKKIEMEHKATADWIKKMCKANKCPSDSAIATKISKDHLKENSNYYLHLVAMEKKMRRK